MWKLSRLDELDPNLAYRAEYARRPAISESGVAEWYHHFVEIGRGPEAPDQVLLGLDETQYGRILVVYIIGDADLFDMPDPKLSLPEFLATLPSDYRRIRTMQ